MRFESPWFLLLFLVLAGIVYFRRSKKLNTTITYSKISHLKPLENPWTRLLVRIMPFLRFTVVCLLILGMARPQTVTSEQDILSEGIDIIIAMDTSSSMLAEDFLPKNRLVVSKKTAQSFVKKREFDRIGLVVFGSDAFTQCPLTLDYGVVNEFIADIESGMAGQGTAIGLAIATALNRFTHSKAKSKILILVTDGENNSGQIDPKTATLLAKDLGIKIYTIGVGKIGGAPIPYDDPVFGKRYRKSPNGELLLTKLDEELLTMIASETGGLYFRATDKSSLEKIYTDIDSLEKTKIKTKKYNSYTDLFPILLWTAFGLLLLEFLISNIVLVRLP